VPEPLHLVEIIDARGTLSFQVLNRGATSTSANRSKLAGAELHLTGSDEIVRIAGAALNSNVDTRRFLFCDQKARLLEDDEQEEYSQLLREAVQTDLRAVGFLMSHALRGLYVCGVDLYSRELGASTVEIGGIVRTNKPEALADFLTSALRRWAWPLA
jgi:hypothetical protein